MHEDSSYRLIGLRKKQRPEGSPPKLFQGSPPFYNFVKAALRHNDRAIIALLTILAVFSKSSQVDLLGNFLKP